MGAWAPSRYWALPSAVVGGCMLLYFSGVPALQSLVAPHVNRELGILETAQHLVIFFLLVHNLAVARRQPHSSARWLWWAIAAATAFILLEELDYGQHYTEFLRGLPPEMRSKVRSVHDGPNTQRIKGLSVVLEVGFFCVLPLLAARLPSAKLRRLAPAIGSISTAALGFVFARLAHVLDDAGWGAGGALYSGIGEFRELFTYWVWSQYFRDLAARDRWRASG